jgi:predicted phage terminase large subunit-like protein
MLATVNNQQVNPAFLLDLIKAEKERRLAENSFSEFVKQAWHIVEPGVEYIHGWHIQTICEHLEAVTRGEIRKLLINIPPRHAKSTIVSVMWPVWEWLSKPEQKYLCASYSSVLSIRDALKARRLLQSPWFQNRWGLNFQLTGDQNAKQRYENSNTGYRIASSVGGTATGEGGSRLILDDPHGAQDAQSDVIRQSTIEWFDMVWSTRLNSPANDAMVTIMQRLHEGDVSGHILNDIGGWEHLCLPAEYDGLRRKTSLGFYDTRTKVNELLWPERFTEQVITGLKQVLGEYGTAGQLQQDPTPSGGGLLKTEHFQLWKVSESMPSFEYILQSYDCAFTEKTTGDPTACTVWGIFTHKNHRNVMLLDAWDEHLGYPQLRKRVIEDWTAEYGGDKKSLYNKPRKPDRILVEEKASGQSLLQDLRLAKVPAIGYNPGRADKVARAHQMAPTLELDMIWIPESSKNLGQFVSWSRPFLKQLAKFPVAEHDDYVDTASQAILYLKNDGWFNLPIAKDIDEPKIKRVDKVNPYAA